MENLMRSTSFAVAVALLAGAVAPTLAAPKHSGPKVAKAPSYEDCEALAVDRALPPNQGPSATQDAPFNAFMKDCLAGKIPFDDHMSSSRAAR